MGNSMSVGKENRGEVQIDSSTVSSWRKSGYYVEDTQLLRLLLDRISRREIPVDFCAIGPSKSGSSISPAYVDVKPLPHTTMSNSNILFAKVLESVVENSGLTVRERPVAIKMFLDPIYTPDDNSASIEAEVYSKITSKMAENFVTPHVVGFVAYARCTGVVDSLVDGIDTPEKKLTFLLQLFKMANGSTAQVALKNLMQSNLKLSTEESVEYCRALLGPAPMADVKQKVAKHYDDSSKIQLDLLRGLLDTYQSRHGPQQRQHLVFLLQLRKISIEQKIDILQDMNKPAYDFKSADDYFALKKIKVAPPASVLQKSGSNSPLDGKVITEKTEKFLQQYHPKPVDAVQFLVLEQAVNSLTMKEWLKNPALDKKTIVAAMFQVVYTIECFLREGLVHNDLHLGNIFMQKTVPVSSAESSSSGSATREPPHCICYQVTRPDTGALLKRFYLPVDPLPLIFDFDRASITGAGLTHNTHLDQGLFCRRGTCDIYHPNLDTFKFLMGVWAQAGEDSKAQSSWDTVSSGFIEHDISQELVLVEQQANLREGYNFLCNFLHFDLRKEKEKDAATARRDLQIAIQRNDARLAASRQEFRNNPDELLNQLNMIWEPGYTTAQMKAYVLGAVDGFATNGVFFPPSPLSGKSYWMRSTLDILLADPWFHLLETKPVGKQVIATYTTPLASPTLPPLTMDAKDTLRIDQCFLGKGYIVANDSLKVTGGLFDTCIPTVDCEFDLLTRFEIPKQEMEAFKIASTNKFGLKVWDSWICDGQAGSGLGVVILGRDANSSSQGELITLIDFMESSPSSYPGILTGPDFNLESKLLALLQRAGQAGIALPRLDMSSILVRFTRKAVIQRVSSMVSVGSGGGGSSSSPSPLLKATKSFPSSASSTTNTMQGRTETKIVEEVLLAGFDDCQLNMDPEEATKISVHALYINIFKDAHTWKSRVLKIWLKNEYGYDPV